MATPQPPFRVRAIYSWSGTEEDDLGFIEGDIIEVNDLGDGNWWHGRLKRNKMTGNFPSNYVEVIKADFQNFNSSGAKEREVNSMSSSFNNTPERSSRHQSPQAASIPSPYSKNDYNHQREYIDQDHDDLQFSFQSSRNYYTDSRGQTGRNSLEDPYSKHKVHREQHHLEEYHLPHSKSVPVRLEDRGNYESYNDSRYRKSRPNNIHQSANVSTRNSSQTPSPNVSDAPPLPHHALPVKSHSSSNLKMPEQYTYSSNYSRPEISTRRSALLNQASYIKDPRESQTSEFVPPYDPETLNQSRSTASQSSNVFSYSNGSYFTSSQSSHNSSFAMSDFSATSAGSFARHKYEEQMGRNDLNTSASGNNLLVEDQKVKPSSGLLKKFFVSKEAPPLPSVDSLTDNIETMTVEEKQMNTWIEFKIDLNRTNSLSSKERQLREKRVRENEGYIILEPHKQLSTINNNEVYQTGNKLDLHSISLNHVDNFVRNLKTTSNIMSPESFIMNELGMKYSSKLEYLRALFILCTEHFQIVESKREPVIEEIFQTKETNSLGLAYLFRYLAKMTGLKSELISGSLKTPQSIIRHHWNSVLINGEWRFIDVGLGNLTHPIYELMENSREGQNESFYFLTEPLNLIYTHIPDKFEEQHIVPPIDPMVALALPPCFPSFFKNGLSIYKFNNALTRLKDYEIFEIDLKIPKDIEVNAVVRTKNAIINTLTQVYWKHNDRFCKIKGHLPNNNSTGFINIYSGLKGIQKSMQNIHPLSLVVPITHEGLYRPLEFVIRYPTVPAQQYDLYIKQPQNKDLTCNADYVFSVLKHPSNGLNSITTRSKIALQSPSGRIVKLVKKDQSTPYGTWELPVKCNEVGVWRGLVSVDNGTSLCVFAEWHCK